MGRKKGPKKGQKNTILTQRKNVQINVQECPALKKSKKVTFYQHIFLLPFMQRTNIFKNFHFSFFQKTAKKKIICIKSILDIFIFVHFQKVDPSFVFDVFFDGKKKTKIYCCLIV